MPDWTIQYEQTPWSDTWVYKFDHSPRADGAWYPLRRDAQAWYRVSGSSLQVVIPDEHIPEETLRGILVRIAAAGPLETDDALEVEIRSRADAYVMTSHWVNFAELVKFERFTADELNRAYQRLREVEEQS